MSGPTRRTRRTARCKKQPTTHIGTLASNADTTLRSLQVGSLPLLNHFIEQLDLERILRQHLPEDDVRQEIPTERIVLLLVRNVLVSREPTRRVSEGVPG